MKLLDLLKYRLEVAKAFTKEHQDEVERCVDDYELKRTEEEKLSLLNNPNKRYEFKIPYIFATHESMLSSMFDRVPDLVMRKRGVNDEEKVRKIKAAYEYLVDKLNLEGVMTESAWWFLLTGFVTAHGSYKSEYREVPVVNPDTGEVEVDEMGEPVTRIEYTYDDPVVRVGKPDKEFYSPESEFTNEGDKIPYMFTEEMMDVETIKNTYEKKVDPDAEVKVEDLKSKKDSTDLKRAKVYMYYGRIPEDTTDTKQIKDWDKNTEAYIVFTNKEILYAEGMKNGKLCRFGKWHGRPTSFFGFGIGKTLREIQIEMSVRRGQQMRYADVAAFPKIAVDVNTEFDSKAILDPREQVVLLYKDKPPAYLTPPDLSNTLLITEEKAREDAQFISGMLDLSKGAQDSQVVKTATGQTIFAEAAEKRIKQAKRQFGRYWRSVIVMLLELARDNWQEDKIALITDQNGMEQEISISSEDLKDIDFDLDLDIDMESVSVNKEALRAQSIELYDKFKDDPMIDRKMVVEKVLRDGFNENDPERFITEQGMQGNTPMQPHMNGSPGEIPTSNAGITGAANGMGI